MKYNSTEYPVAWFRDRYNDGSLILRPPYQRKPVWSVKQKNALVESILLELPIPELYLQHAIEGPNAKSIYALVDGQQRIRTVLQFIGIDRTEGELEENSFTLDKLAASSKYKGKTIGTLDQIDRDCLLKYKFAVRSIDTNDEDELREVFKRINRYVTKLNEQELRNATYTGPFITLANQLADDEFWVQKRLVSPAQIRRMKDIEFVSELLIGVIHGPQGGSAAVVNEYYSQFDDYDDEFPNQKQVVDRFLQTKMIVSSILSSSVFSRFSSNRTDFYSLFVAVAVLLVSMTFQRSLIGKLRAALITFEGDVNARLADESKKVASRVVDYVRAAEKGVNDKKRRSDRHGVLLELLSPYFK